MRTTDELAEAIQQLTAALDAYDTSLQQAVGQALQITRSDPATRALLDAQATSRKTLDEVKRSAGRVTTQLDQLDQLVRTTALITSTLDLDEVLEEVIDTVVDLTGAERVYLMLHDESGSLKMRTARNWDQQTLSQGDIGLSQSVVNAALENGEAIVTTNAQADQRFASKESIVMQKLRSIICVPLTISGKTVGVLYADNRFRMGAFSDEMIPVLNAFGTQAAIAIFNAQVFGQVQQNLDEAKQRIRELQIQIDKDKVDEQVRSITQTGFFQELADAAEEMRRRQREQRDRDSE
ncbi:MAG: GAF domain-containing protein [Chloroflexi bacterium]|nr:GAF domain-containing protein [Chloroflexota bacterium]